MTQDEKDNILGNVSSIPAKVLSEHIVNKHINLKEIMETGELEPHKRVEIELIVKNREKEIEEKKLADEQKEKQKEKQEWEILSKLGDPLALEEFIKEYHGGTHYLDACNLLDEINKRKKEKSDILEKIRNNNNSFTPDTILEYIQNKTISKEDLLSINIPNVIIDNLNLQKQKLDLGKIPEKIEDGVTEVYFWGLPGSGKTCALSAILSEGVRNGEIITKDGPGLLYMNQMSNIFLKNYAVLPGRTNLEQTQYLPFELKDKKGREHPIALIELSGEIFRSFFLKSAGLEIPESSQTIYDRVKSYLSSNNKKIHFFIIDITKDPLKPDQDGTTQQQYLRAMENFLNNNNIFKNTTDGVYIVTTKSDNLSDDVTARKELAIQHLKKDYSSFIESLKRTLKKNNLSKSIYVIPFSLGKVYFNDLCHFDNTSSQEVIDLLKENTSVGIPEGILRKIRKIMKKFNS